LGRSIPTDEPAVTYPSLTADTSLRLQQLVNGWRGAERGEPLIALHNACVNAVGPGGRHLVPAHLLLVQDLEVTNLQIALRNLNGRGQGAALHFRVRPTGRFDAVLVPTRLTGDVPDRWLLAVEETLSLQDQVALYGHALGHLLLNREQEKMGRLPDPDPKAGYSHFDMLAELRMLETVRQPLDRRVLEAYPLLTELLGVREESPAVLDLVTSDLRQRLAQFGWRGPFVETPYVFTNGRVFVRGTSTQHGRKLRVDALLRAAASLPIAVVQTIHAGQAREEVIRRLKEYAHHRLAVPFAYLLEEDGTIMEFDWSASEEPIHTTLTALPSSDALWNRWAEALDLTDRQAKEALHYPYQLSNPKPRYYQEAAINRAIIAVLQAKRNMRPSRILLTLATGTGKTKIAFQLIWKLKRTRAIRNVLYLTDRDWLLSQAMDNEFAPFGDARQRILGEASTSRDVLFATYQAMADSETSPGLYHDFPRDFFDVIIVDECHRGSAQADSRWRIILEYFNSAVQIGMTATPLSTNDVQTDEYFGKPIYTYSLRTGINDGFLAPYRVRSILMGPKQEDTSQAEAEKAEQTDKFVSDVSNVSVVSLVADVSNDEDEYHQISSDPIIEETSATLRARTQVIAQHLANFLKQTDPLAKTIVFCVDQSHAEEMREALEQVCSEFVTRYHGYIERIVSDEGTDGKRALGRFSTPAERTPVIVTTSRLLSTGVDVPTCQNIVLARPVGSLVEFKQIIGRGSRLYEPDKTWFTIIDYAGAIKLFFDPNFDGDPELVEVEPLIPQIQSEKDTSTHETEEEAVQDVSQPAIIQIPFEPAVKDGGTTYPQDQEPAVRGPGTREGCHYISDDHEKVGRIEGTSTQRTNFPVVEQPPVSIPVSQGSTTTVEPPTMVKQLKNGITIQVIGEYVYDLGPDGKTLHPRSSYRDYATAALTSIITKPEDLRARWLSKEQRQALCDQLQEEGVDLQTLATALHLPDVDPLDILLHVAFGQSKLTRSERVERLYREHLIFFSRYKPEAREILDTILKKYIVGEAQDVSDTELLKVPPLDERGTFIELAKPFGGGAYVRSALKELQQLLYSA
jgi:type I restriction enzyme, R subunit